MAPKGSRGKSPTARQMASSHEITLHGQVVHGRGPQRGGYVAYFALATALIAVAYAKGMMAEDVWAWVCRNYGFNFASVVGTLLVLRLFKGLVFRASPSLAFTDSIACADDSIAQHHAASPLLGRLYSSLGEVVTLASCLRSAFCGWDAPW